jgi:hypothetical protein
MYISAQDQIIDYAYNPPHGAFDSSFPIVGVRKFNGLAIS